MKKLDEKAWELLNGGYDLHVHTAPSAFPRALDSFQLVREANEAGMSGVMLKSHYEPTAIRAALVNLYSNCKTRAYGAVVLNWPVGGLNIYAVENALRVGARIVWMPTRDSANSLAFGDMEGDFFNRRGITILEEDGRLKPVVYDIMDAVKKQGASLATGHLSPRESIFLCREGRSRGVRMILTHPEFCRTVISADLQEEMADLGVIIEKNWLNVAAAWLPSSRSLPISGGWERTAPISPPIADKWAIHIPPGSYSALSLHCYSKALRKRKSATCTHCTQIHRG